MLNFLAPLLYGYELQFHEIPNGFPFLIAIQGNPINILSLFRVRLKSIASISKYHIDSFKTNRLIFPPNELSTILCADIQISGRLFEENRSFHVRKRKFMALQ